MAEIIRIRPSVVTVDFLRSIFHYEKGNYGELWEEIRDGKTGLYSFASGGTCRGYIALQIHPAAISVEFIEGRNMYCNSGFNILREFARHYGKPAVVCTAPAGSRIEKYLCRKGFKRFSLFERGLEQLVKLAWVI